ncbi:hypothetical protein [Brevundimonas diminuta]|uniref:hypothetical protein n=1 Tax=Brevundimonas diminuta TaxID=293 RepID=UPI0006278D8F|nr:hypothetical protein [Brevundimonas diminuta]
MPQVALAAASFTTTAATTAMAATAAKAAMVATLKSVAISVVKNLAIAAAMSALQPQVGAAGRTFEWTLDPDGPIPFAAGRVGVAGSAVHRKTFGPDLMYYGFVSVISGAGPIDGYETFRGDDEFVAFDAAGRAVTSQWTGEMWMRQTLGAQPDVALPSPSGLKHNATLPMWSGSHRLSGKAAYLMVLGENSKRSAYPTGEPRPLHVVRGLKGWDPRRDSTYPGGLGPCRLHDPSTWLYITNPILWGLKWALGLWESPVGKGAPQVGYQVGGIGAKLSGIDVPAFVAAANVADANGWTVAAYPTTDDDKGQVLDSFLQAGGAIYAQRAGKISCISRAAPRPSLVTITAFDTAGPLEIDTAASRIDRINTIRPKFWSEAHRWQLTAIDDVTAQAYQDEDGGVRPRPLDYHYVPSAKQAAQLAALQIAHTREGIAGVIPLKPHMQRIRPGDAFTITEPGFVLNGLKCLCLNTEYDPATRIVRVSFVSESDGKYAWALGQSPTPPAPPALTPVDPTHVSPPLPGEWIIMPRPPGAGGSLVPGFDLWGEVGNSTATAIEVQWWEVPVGVDPHLNPPEGADWQSAGSWPPTARTIPINVQGDRYYWIGLIYIRGQNYSERLPRGPWLAGKLVADDVTHIGGRPVGDFTDLPERVAAIDGEVDAINAEVDQQRADLAGVAAGLVNNGVAITQEAQRRETDDEVMATTLGLIGARSPDGLTFIIDRDKVMVGPGVSFAQRDSLIEARFAGTASSHIFTVASTAAEEASASAEALRQMGVDLANASAWQLDSAKIKVTPTETLNQRLISIGAALTNRPTGDEVDARVTSAMNAGVGADGVIAEYVNAVFTKKGEFETRAGMLLEAIDGVSARASLFVDANGRVGGVNVGAEQERLDLELAFDRVFFVDVSSGAKVQVLNYIGGQWTFDSNVRITGDLFVDGTIHNEKIQQNTITGLSASYQAGQINLNGTAPVVVAEVWTAVEKTGSPVVIDFNAWLQLRHDASGSFTSTIEIRRSADTGVGVQILTHTVEGSGMANDTFAGMVPFKVIDRPGPGFWRYFVRISSNTDTMSVQNSKTRYISATEYKTNQ